MNSASLIQQAWRASSSNAFVARATQDVDYGTIVVLDAASPDDVDDNVAESEDESLQTQTQSLNFLTQFEINRNRNKARNEAMFASVGPGLHNEIKTPDRRPRAKAKASLTPTPTRRSNRTTSRTAIKTAEQPIESPLSQAVRGGSRHVKNSESGFLTELSTDGTAPSEIPSHPSSPPAGFTFPPSPETIQPVLNRDLSPAVFADVVSIAFGRQERPSKHNTILAEPEYLKGVPLRMIEDNDPMYTLATWTTYDEATMVMLSMAKRTSIQYLNGLSFETLSLDELARAKVEKVAAEEDMETLMHLKSYFKQYHGFHPNQLLAKELNRNSGLVDLGTLIHLRKILEVAREGTKCEIIMMSPLEWLRGRLGQIVEVIGRDNFDLKATIKNFGSDREFVTMKAATEATQRSDPKKRHRGKVGKRSEESPAKKTKR